MNTLFTTQLGKRKYRKYIHFKITNGNLVLKKKLGFEKKMRI